MQPIAGSYYFTTDSVLASGTVYALGTANISTPDGSIEYTATLLSCGFAVKTYVAVAAVAKASAYGSCVTGVMPTGFTAPLAASIAKESMPFP